MSHIEEEFQQIEDERAWTTFFRKLANDHGVRNLEKKTSIATLSLNRALNRFRDVLPYDDTRVKLQRGPNDYINANYIEVPWANRKYILTQGPLPTTADHFWQMVWEQNSRVIVMLTHLIEKGSNKCWLYYPDYENDSELTFHEVDLKVTFVSEQQGDHYIRRKFELINLLTGEARPIIHWSDFDWPDHGVPSSPEPFLQLLSDVRHSGAFDPRYGAPILHCSAGIGRSGTFVLVDSILKMLAHSENPREISLTEVLAHIRTQRNGLIQTPEQLRFSYMAIAAGLRELDELEQSEEPFNDESDDAGESDEDDDGKLSRSLEDLNAELKHRANLAAELFPKAESAAPISTDVDTETSLRLREERLKRNEAIEKKIHEIKTKMNEQSTSSSMSFLRSNRPSNSFFDLLMTKYRRPLFLVFVTVLTGSVFFYKYRFNNDRTH